jgi:two-component system, NtrC family, sensor histidine kinase HydH
MRLSDFESISAYTEFSADSAAALREFHPVAQPHFHRIIDDFYDTIEAHPRARQVITGGRPQIERLKQTLVRWLESTLLGPYDAAYLEAHSRIGRVHVRISLPQEFMFTAMNRIRSRLLEVAIRAYVADPEQQRRVLVATNQILDLELAIMLDTYRANLEERLRAQERLATIGQLAASIGHELRNPLGVIESSLFLIRQRLAKISVDDSNVNKHLDKVAGQVKVCSKTITDLLELARSRPPRRQRVDVSVLVEHSLESVPLEADVVVESDLPRGLDVYADPDQMRQVLVNLMANASQAMAGRGRIRISAEREKGGVAIRVSDEGPGVPAADRVRIFDALYTTKPKGTGLGLALCRRIIEAHGGEIVLEPSQSGATFRFWVPDEESAATGLR